MGPLVMVVEDDPYLALTLKGILEEHGNEVLLAKDGEEALDLLGVSRVPALIILDLVLPRLDGWNLLEILHEVSPVPVIATSGLAPACLAKHATVFLPKPLDLDELLGEVERCLGARTSLDTAPGPRAPDQAS
ncbi:MAG TPA: response regulator [Myxococcales bacterium]|jgi:CheY-like chemotaxis protein